MAIKLLYWKDVPNFGDLLSPYLISELSGDNIIYKQRYFGVKFVLKRICQILRYRAWRDYSELTRPHEKILVGIGSLLKWGNHSAIYWGSGFMKATDIQHFRGGQVLAVRGYLSAKALSDNGYKSTSVVGDPALILPLIISKSEETINELGIIPHWSETDEFMRKFHDKNIISLKTDDIADVVKRITSCRYILSTSLHGVIVAHAYGVPAIWIQNGYIDTDGFKFYDYFSAVEISKYDGFRDFEKLLNDNDALHQFFNEHKAISLPKSNVVSQIVKNLLDVAPFNVKKKYRQ